MFAFRADPLGFLQRCAATYGDVCAFRGGKRRFILMSHPDDIRDVLVAKAEHFTKSPALRQAKVMLGEGLLTSEGDFHRRQRRLSQPAFHPQRVATYAAAMVKRAAQTSAEWHDGETVDLHDSMMRLTLRVVTDTLFGADIDNEIAEIGRAMDVLVRMFDRARNPLAPILNRLPLPSNYRFLRAARYLAKTLDRFVAERRAQGANRGDLLSTLIRARDSDADEGSPAPSSDFRSRLPEAGENEGMSDRQLRDELLTLFAAGHETTANALTFAWRLVARHPEVAAKLYEEVDRELSGDAANSAAVDRLPYTRAVVSEAMRLYPPAWVLMREAKNDVKIGPREHTIDAGDIIITCQWVVHHDERWWPDPMRFDPMRWFDEAAKEARLRYAYFPFGGGPRSCIGEAFAWTEATLLLAHLAKHWRMEDVSKKPMRLLPTITLRPKDPVWVKLTRR
jgi:cytochrome P450